MFTNGILKFVEDVYQKTLIDPAYLGTYSQLNTTFRSVAGIGALVYIFSRLIGQIARGESIDFFPYMRPFMLVGFLALAPSLCDVIDDVGETLWNKNKGRNTQIYASIQRLETKVDAALRRKWELKANNPTVSQTGNGGLGSYFAAALSNMSSLFADKFDEYGDFIKAWLLSVLQDFLMVLLQVAEACLYLMSICFRLVLRLAAPFAIVAAIFPGMSNALVEWIGKYINFTLMPFVASVVGTICYAISENYMTLYLASLTTYSKTGAESADPTLMGIAYIGVLIVCLLLFFQVPSLTNLFVSIGGVGQLMQGAGSRLTSAGMGVARKGATAGKVAGAGACIAGGGVAKGVASAGRAGFNYARGG